MISKQSFCKMLRAVYAQYKEDKRIISLLNDIQGVRSGSTFETPLCEQIITILDESFSNGSYTNDWISYFFFELNFGEKGENCVTDEKGKQYSLRTPEELYDYIIMESQDGK